MEWIGLITLLTNVVLPPAFNLVKSFFGKGKVDTPEQTMSELALTKPDVLPSYVTALGSYLQAQTAYFNRDVAGTPSKWVINLRASIRPVSVILSFLVLFVWLIASVPINAAILITANGVIGNWIGTKIELHP